MRTFKNKANLPAAPPSLAVPGPGPEPAVEEGERPEGPRPSRALGAEEGVQTFTLLGSKPRGTRAVSVVLALVSPESRCWKTSCGRSHCVGTGREENIPGAGIEAPQITRTQERSPDPPPRPESQNFLSLFPSFHSVFLPIWRALFIYFF